MDKIALIASRYQLMEPLGKGGMGEVYRAIDHLNGESVALKRVLTAPGDLSFSLRGTLATNDPRVELAQEFQVLASLRHPNVISVTDYGFADSGEAYYTMTLLESPQTLIQASQGQPLETQIDLVIQLLQGLAYIHRRGLLHRDLKPSNVMVKDQNVYVVDFGLAIQQSDQRSGNIAGTIAYMAPEALQNGSVSPASDLYAVGLMLYEMIAGQHPYSSRSTVELIQHILYQMVDVSQLDIPASLSAIIERLLIKDPDDRYQAATQVLQDLSQAVNIETVETPAIRESFLQAASFIGREDELRALRQTLETMKTIDQGKAWLIGGESGVGKSRLIDELTTRALVDGALVLRGQATTEIGVPYALWRQALKRLALSTPLDDSEAEALALILPDAEQVIGRSLPNMSEIAPQDQEKRITFMLESLFQKASTQQPIVLVLEDLQWMVNSDVEMRMVNTMCLLSSRIPLMVIISYRDDEARDLPEKLSNASVMTLDRLTTDEIARLTTSMLGQTGGRAPIVDLIQRETEGNVFFIVEVVRALAEDAGSIEQIGQVTVPAQIFAGGVQKVIQYRLDRVPGWARQMLNLAAIAGRVIDTHIIAHIDSDFPVEQWLDACVSVAVFEVTDGGYRFAHDKLREGVLDHLPSATRRRHHQTVAVAIERLYADSLSDYAAILARHFQAAGNDQREAYYALMAGSTLIAINNFQEADHFFNRALQLEAHTQADEPRKALGEIYLGLAKSAYGLSNFDIARRYADQAITIFNEIDSRRLYADARNVRGEADFRQGRYEEARGHVQAGLKIRRELGENLIDIGYSLMNLGVIEHHSGDEATARRYFEDCLATMRQTGNQIAIARALNNLAISYDVGGDFDQALTLYQDSLAIRRAINDRQGIAYSLVNLSQLYQGQKQADTERIMSMLLEALEHIRFVGEKMATASIASTLANVYRQIENYDEAETYEMEALTIRQQIGERVGMTTSLRGLGMIALERQQYDIATDYFIRSLEVLLEIEHRAQVLQNVRFTIPLLIEQGRFYPALVCAYAALNFGEDLPTETDDLKQQIETIKPRLDAVAVERAQVQASPMTLKDIILYLLNTLRSQ